MGDLGNIRLKVKKWRENQPSVCPASLCDNFKAGNLKNMKMYIEPSNTLAVRPRANNRLSRVY